MNLKFIHNFMKKISSKAFAFGSPNNLVSDKDAQIFFKKIIENEHYVHSCLDYGGMLQKISEIVNLEDLKINLISKIYLNFPNYLSKRRNTLLNQIIQIQNLFPKENLELVPQISSIWSLPNYGYKKFILRLYKDLSVKRILIEVFPENERNSIMFAKNILDAISELNLETKISVGLTTYENKEISGVTTNIKSFINENSLEFAPMRILGNLKSKNDLKLAINSFSSLVRYKYFFCGITKVSSEAHYEQLLDLFNKQDFSQKNDIFSSNLILNNKLNRIPAKNPYGIYQSKNKNLLIIIKTSIKYLFLNPSLKTIILIIKKRFMKGF